jgi:hypothetical protein
MVRLLFVKSSSTFCFDLSIGRPWDNNVMAKKWIDDVVGGIKGRSERTAEERRLFLHQVELIKSEAPRFWNSLMAIVKEDVAEFNAHFPEDSLRQIDISTDPISLRVAMRNRTFPQTQISLVLNLIAGAIEIEIEKTFNICSRAQSGPLRRITFQVKPDNTLTPVFEYSLGYSLEHMAELILTPLFQEVA